MAVVSLLECNVGAIVWLDNGVGTVIILGMKLRAGEIAKDIEDWKGLYAVTTLGRIWSYPRIIRGCGNRDKWLQPGHWMKPQISGDPTRKGAGGYLQVGLTRNGRRKMFCLHILVAKAFIPNPRRLDEANHIDGVKTNCFVKNLEWCTHAENMEHARRNGLYAKQSSKFRGVSYNKHKKRWIALTTENGKYKYIGQFMTEEEAANARIAYDHKNAT